MSRGRRQPCGCVIAPDSFKGSLGAAAAAAALAAGWQAARPGDEVRSVPLADGGEGTLDVLAAAVPGARWHQAQVTGPAGPPVDCPWLELPGRHRRGGAGPGQRAAAAGAPDPLGAHTTGLGEVIGRALDAGARQVTIALGGSASTDGGTGRAGRARRPVPRRRRPPAAAGRRGAARPGRGGPDRAAPAPGRRGELPVRCARPAARPGRRGGRVRPAEGRQPGPGRPARGRAWPGWPGCSAATRRAPGAGAAGGTGYGLAAAWGALIGPGAAQLGRLAGLDQALAGAGLVITGEGRYDETSGTGKVGRDGVRRRRGGRGARRAGGRPGRGRPAARRGLAPWRLADLAGRRGRRRWPTRPLAAPGRAAAGRSGRPRGAAAGAPGQRPLPWARAGDRGVQRQRPPGAGGRDLRGPGRAAAPGAAAPVRQRLPGGPAPVQLPGTRRVPHPAAVPRRSRSTWSSCC